MEFESDCLPLVSTPLNPLVKDYLLQQSNLKHLYQHEPALQGISSALASAGNFPASRRMILADALEEQYTNIGLADEKRIRLIHSLKEPKTFTITTGQQLGLLLGPLYTVLKITHTISLAAEMKKLHPESDFIPMFWMASEDHDIEEINHFNMSGKKFVWNTAQKGPAGKLNTSGIQQIIEDAFRHKRHIPQIQQFEELCSKAYALPTLADATRFLVHHLFENTDLLIIDGDHKALKAQFAPIALNDITGQISFKQSRPVIEQLRNDYKVQVEGREINFFYLDNQYRERIEKINDVYQTVDGRFSWTGDSFSEEISKHPESFSPNVLMRPVYQEFILPNLAYVGGAAEVAYWLELKPVFDAHNVAFPALLLRNSAMFLDRINHHRFYNANLENSDLFLSLHDLEKKVVGQLMQVDFNLKSELLELEAWFEKLKFKAENIHPSLQASSLAMKQRFIHQTERFAKKLIREAKKKERQGNIRIHELYAHLHPNGSLQERVFCYPHFLEHYHSDFLRLLLENMHGSMPASMLVFKF